MNTAKERILANYQLEEGTFYYDFVEKAVFHTDKFLAFLDDIYTVTNECAEKSLDRELLIALNAIQTYVFESCLYHAQEHDSFEIECYPGDQNMTLYLDALKDMVACFFAGKTVIKPIIEEEEKSSKVLVFTTIEKFGYISDVKTDEETLTEEFVEFIEAEYGFLKENMIHESFYASEAMNGEQLYIEIVSEDKEAVKEIQMLISSANIRTRSDLENWVKNFTLLSSEGDIDQPDEYLIQL